MKAIIVSAGLLLCGCSTINGLRTDLSSRAVQTGDEEKALIQNLMSAYQPCVTTPSPTAVACNKFRIVNEAATVEPFVEAGITLSDFYCDTFFRNSNQSSRKRRFARNATNDVGGALATVLGLARAGSGVVGGLAAGFSFADSGYRNYDESFMVDADLSKMRRLVLSAQDNMKLSISRNPPKSYFAGESTIIRYAGLCSFLGMQDLLNESVSEKTVRIEIANKKETPVDNPIQSSVVSENSSGKPVGGSSIPAGGGSTKTSTGSTTSPPTPTLVKPVSPTTTEAPVAPLPPPNN